MKFSQVVIDMADKLLDRFDREAMAEAIAIRNETVTESARALAGQMVIAVRIRGAARWEAEMKAERAAEDAEGLLHRGLA